MNKFIINDKTIGEEGTYVIAEMSANHAGSLAYAKEIIHAAKESGADCVKLQTYTADTITIDCKNEYFTLNSGIWKGENLYELYKRAYTPWEWQEELVQLANQLDIDIISTPFDKTAVDFLENLNIKAYKIASFELVDLPLLEYVAKKGKPMIISTGMANLTEIQEAYDTVIQTKNTQISFLKCISAYPASVNEMNLRTIIDLKERFQIPIGLSDHSMGNLATTIAVSLGASIIEKHFCLSRKIDTPDSAFSMEPEEFSQMVKQIRDTEKALGMVSYHSLKQEEENIKNRKSIFVIQDIKAGDILTEENIKVIRPAYGMSPKFYNKILGKRAKIDMEYGTPLLQEMILME